MKFTSVLLTLFVLMLLVHEGDNFWRRRRRRRRRCSAQNCQVNGWSSWSVCSQPCGSSGIQTRTRAIHVHASCGGGCSYALRETRACNRYCSNRGTPKNGYCVCRPGFNGKCCQSDVNECVRRPCQHTCVNTHGSYTCRCHSCYTKVGTRCDLRQCKISNKCYAYRTANPSNPCLQCSSINKFRWVNSNKRCNDNNIRTRNDRCVNGACVGTPYSCLPCEQHDGTDCRLKAGYCVIQHNGTRTCFNNQQVNPSNQCQQCHMRDKYKWTNNNSLPCSDSNIRTRNERCVNGACVGTPYSCLPCELHDGTGCRLKAGYCVIQHNVTRTCFNNQQVNPSNQCQLCKASVSKTTWTNKPREQYVAVGCFADRGYSRAFSRYVANLRDQIDWYNLNKIIDACAKKVREHCGWSYFGIQFYGECWSGPGATKTYKKHGISQECSHGVGKENANYVYKLIG